MGEIVRCVLITSAGTGTITIDIGTLILLYSLVA